MSRPPRIIWQLLSPGERVLFCTHGWFGELWSRMAAAFRADVVQLSAPWGQAVDVKEVERVLAADARISKVFGTHNETSTEARDYRVSYRVPGYVFGSPVVTPAYSLLDGLPAARFPNSYVPGYREGI